MRADTFDSRTVAMAEGERPNDDAQGHPRWESAPAGWLKAAASTSTALGLLTYALLRVDYALFYRRFGLKPEDVGLGQAELISQSLSGVVLLLALLFFELLLFALMVLFIGVLGRELGREFRDIRQRYGLLTALLIASTLVAAILGQVMGGTRAGPWVLLAVGLVALWWLLWRVGWRNMAGVTNQQALAMLVVVVFTLSLAFRLSPGWTAVGFVSLFVIAVAIKRASGRRLQHATTDNTAEAPAAVSGDSGFTPAAPPPTRDELAISERLKHVFPSSGARRVTLVAALVVTVVLAETLLAASAVLDANQVRTGHAVEPTFLGTPLVSWGARPVLVSWMESAPPGLEALADHCLLYLGEGSGAVFLYDHDSRTTIRVAAGAVALSIRPATNYALVCPG